MRKGCCDFTFPDLSSPKKDAFLSYSHFSIFPFLCISRATPVRAEAIVVVEEEEEQGMKTTRSPPSHPPTMPTPLCCTSWSTSQGTPSTPCLTMACSTPTPTLSCPPSWCPTCWVRTPISSQGLCTQWVHLLFFVCPFLALALCDHASQALW